jgi:hypothetical protein
VVRSADAGDATPDDDNLGTTNLGTGAHL